MFEMMGDALPLLFTWQSLVALTAGSILGLLVGAIPGVQGSMIVALCLPVTLYLPPVVGILFLLGIYKAANFGGSIPAILVGTPGTVAAVATVFDGFPLTKLGKAGKALRTALYSSVIGDAFSDIIVIFVAVYVARWAVAFGPFEYTALLLFTFLIIAIVSRGSVVKGIIAGALGLAAASVGTDPIQGATRFTFGITGLMGGFSLVAFLMGVYAIPQILTEIQEVMTSPEAAKASYAASPNPEDNRLTGKEFKRILPTIFKSGLIGSILGALPGIGPAIASFVGYGEAQRSSKNKDNFGKGEIEGVAAAEGANSAVCGANLIPLITLGIPGDFVAAVLLGAFYIHGLQPGPMLFQKSGDIVYAILIGMILIDIVILFSGRYLINLLIKVIGTPKIILYPIVFFLAVVGVYAYSGYLFDVVVMLITGIFGYFLRRLGFPLAPMAIGFVLGALTEEKLRQSLILSRNNPWEFLSHPIGLAFLAAALATLAWYIWSERRGKRAEAEKPSLTTTEE